jgi:hypothetical protein
MADEDTVEATGRGDRPRREVPPIKVWVTDAEKAKIAERAALGGLSLSAYMPGGGPESSDPIRLRP